MKFSTDKLKALISTWLNVPEAREDLRHHSDSMTYDDFDKAAGYWKAPKNCDTVEKLEQHIWDLWCDGSRWNCEEEREWGDEADFIESQLVGTWDPEPSKRVYRKVPTFPCDMLGDHNSVLVKKFFDDSELGKKCIYRYFSPDNQLADNYRLEVVTTPDDTEVVGWWVTVD
jgi:hypothetical protein